MKIAALMATSIGLVLALSLVGLAQAPNSGRRFVTGVLTTGPLPTTAVSYEVTEKGLLVMEGDIIAGSVAAGFTPKPLDVGIKGLKYRTARLWTQGTIIYVVDPSCTKVNEIKEAMKEWSTKTKIKFRTREAQDKNYIKFVSVDTTAFGGRSAIGMQGGEQLLELSQSATAGTVLHELGHALGLAHEHMRSDRDKFVKIHFENIEKGYDDQFRILGTQGQDVKEYDYASVMHYPRNAFPKGNDSHLTTIEPLKSGVDIGNRKKLSDTDVRTVNEVYAKEVN